MGGRLQVAVGFRSDARQEAPARVSDALNVVSVIVRARFDRLATDGSPTSSRLRAVLPRWWKRPEAASSALWEMSATSKGLATCREDALPQTPQRWRFGAWQGHYYGRPRFPLPLELRLRLAVVVYFRRRARPDACPSPRGRRHERVDVGVEFAGVDAVHALEFRDLLLGAGPRRTLEAVRLLLLLRAVLLGVLACALLPALFTVLVVPSIRDVVGFWSQLLLGIISATIIRRLRAWWPRFFRKASFALYLAANASKPCLARRRRCRAI